MSKTKYITSGGLAFSEEKDMEKLHRFSLKGWHVSGFKFMGYTLEKGESSDYIYSIDYCSLKEDEKEEYVEFFSSSGWTHVDSEGDIHLFRAHSGTKPIYTDRETTVEKYKQSSSSMNKLAIPFVLITALLWLGTVMSSGTFKSILLVVAAIFSIFAIPTAWTIIATYRNKWEVEGRKGIVKVVKLIPFLLLIIAIIMLLFFYGTNNSVGLLTSMIIGGIALPTAIWVVMSLYHKVGGKRK
ncbi:DUF2812 domain-containing protein [Niallia sp. Krafla_26]|uniref:DUF2812 domain-containing protein n=1 Tax=Niallia sp. Krafla_26 TaxID=3064703 RepID=UPI003D1845A4